MLHVRIAIACLVAALLGQNGFGADVADDKTFTDQVRPFLVKHCQDCHNEKKPKGDFRVDTLSADFDKLASRDRWQAVLKKVKAGEMPPASKPRPAGPDLQNLYDWTGRQMDRGRGRKVVSSCDDSIASVRTRCGVLARESESALPATARRTGSITSARRATSSF